MSKNNLFHFARALSVTVRTVLGARTMWKGACFAALLSVLWLYLGISLFWSAIATLVVYELTGGWDFTEVVVKTIGRDARALSTLLYLKYKIKKYNDSGCSIVDVFHETLSRHPDKYAFISVDTGKKLTFRDVEDYSNSVANYFYQEGYRKGDVVALFMENCPEYAPIWLGMAKIGVHAALINFNLRDESLAHCLTISGAKSVIYSATFIQAIKDIDGKLPNNFERYVFSDDNDVDVTGAKHINPLIAAQSTLSPKISSHGFHDKLFYIYTSGTTGLPKAANVSQSRFYYMCSGSHYLFNMTEDDIVYDVLPLYHTAGGILGVGQAFVKGCTVVLRKKFSASRFWDDCVQHNCTVVQYIGELCRYLLAQPHRPSENQHRVRCAFGNGLRPQIWVEFKERFGIQRIGEFYGATEGNANIMNIDNTVGSVGFTTMIAPSLYPIALIRINEQTGEPLRGPDGLCIKCKPGEPGELVGKIVKGDPLRSFDGYANKEATSKKIARNVFSRGDQAFLTGDVLVMDRYGNMFFKDRTGDTFRWRGENVSTAEVEASISNIIKLNDAVVYGVEVPGSEGRAGMAAIVDDNHSIDLDYLYKELCSKLPAYARPLFIRLLEKVDTTGTFKLKKVEYRNEGINPNNVSDQMYYLNAREGKYLRLTPDVYNDIKTGQIRL